ncbi:family 1 glycosylhydrolase [Streptomyces sp. NPDC003090]|uniref:family 1 glycosylhydrolase n=1 Tax=Streptomyces sp. NPDC003090 TaxID=3154274 RepID=UPI0037FF5FF2
MVDPAAFPPGFACGAATSAYQTEGATREGGRGPSIRDTFARRAGAVPGRRHRRQGLRPPPPPPGGRRPARGLGVDTYRFSVAWPRVQPSGEGPLNEPWRSAFLGST